MQMAVEARGVRRTPSIADIRPMCDLDALRRSGEAAAGGAGSCSVKPFALMLCLFLASSCSASAQTFDPRDPHSPLHLVRMIELPGVTGRIDHMSLDTDGTHLFIAENGNGSVD